MTYSVLSFSQGHWYTLSFKPMINVQNRLKITEIVRDIQWTL